MAVLRDSQPQQINIQDTRTGPRAQVGSVGNRNAGLEVLNFENYFPGSSSSQSNWQTDLLGTLVNSVSPYVGQIQQNLQENAYLDGQARASLGQAEEAIDSDPITAMWQTAGHRDMANQLRMAQATADFERDLPNLAKKSPQEVAAYLAQRREELMPYLNMSTSRARDGLIGRLAVSEQSEIAKHFAAHTAYIKNQHQTATGAVMETSFNQLKSARELASVDRTEANTQAFQTAVNKVMGDVRGGVWETDRISYGDKVAWSKDILETALQRNEIALYEQLSRMEVPGPDGKPVPLYATLSPGDREKLAGKHRETYDRTQIFRNMEARQAVQFLEAQLGAGEYEGTYDDVTRFVREHTALYGMSQSQGDSIIQKYHENAFKRQKTWAGADAFVSGDNNKLTALGMSESQAGQMLKDSFRKGPDGQPIPTEKQLPVMFTAGANGRSAGYKMAGEVLETSLNQLDRGDGTVDSQHANNIRMLFTHLDGLEAGMRGNSLTRVLEGMSDANQTRTLRLRAFMQDDKLSFEQALMKTQELEKAEAVSGNVRKVVEAESVKELRTALQDYDAQGLVSSGWTKLKSFLSQDAASQSKLNAKTSPWSNDQTKAEFTRQTHAAIADEAASLQLRHPDLKGSDLVSKAAANVARRSITTDQGVLILPRNVDKNALLGLRGNETDEEVGAAISKVIAPKMDGGRTQLTYGNGALGFQEFNKDGEPTTNAGLIDPRSVRGAVDEARAQRFKQIDKVSGAGATRKVGDAKVTFSGRNSAAVPDDWMYEFRNNLVSNEGVKFTPYDDASGKVGKDGNRIQTVGVGVSSHNPNYPKPGPDGKITQEQLERSFEGASNDAANSARRILDMTGMTGNKEAFKLVAEMAYQSGGNFDKAANKYNIAFIRALAAGDKPAAIELLKKTDAYTYSHDDRKKHYEALTNKAIPKANPLALNFGALQR